MSKEIIAHICDFGSHIKETQSAKAGMPHQGHEAAGHTASTVGKPREMLTGTQVFFPFIWSKTPVHECH